MDPVPEPPPPEPVRPRARRWLGVAAAVGCYHVIDTLARTVGNLPESRDSAIGVGVLLGLAGLLPPQTRWYAVGFTLGLSALFVLQYVFLAAAYVLTA